MLKLRATMLMQIRQFASQAHNYAIKMTNNDVSPRILRLRCGPRRITRCIIRHTKICRDHWTPEIALNLITPECRMHRSDKIDYRKPFDPSTYWAYYMAGQQGISRFLLDNPDLVKDKGVLEIGGGCGAISIAAMKCNARYVLVNEPAYACRCASLLNAMLNDIPMKRFIAYSESLIGFDIKEDIIIISNMQRYKSEADAISNWLDTLHAQKKIILIADVHRTGRDNLESHNCMCKLKSYKLPEKLKNESGMDYVAIRQY